MEANKEELEEKKDERPHFVLDIHDSVIEQSSSEDTEDENGSSNA